MKISRYQSTEEKTILTALIVHDGVLSRIYQQLGPKAHPFKNKWSNLIAHWCLAYFAQYRKAPRRSIQSLFVKYAQSEPDENAVGLVDTFLTSLSKDYVGLAQEMNERYLIDLASNHFEKIRLGEMAETVQDAIDRGDLEKARASYSSCELDPFSEHSWSNPFTPGEVRNMLRFYEEDRCVLRFRGDMDRFFSPFFERGGFISFAGSEKKGKSFWLQEMVWLGLRQRRRVLYYVLGDMSKEQAQRRLYCRATLRPFHRKKISFPIRIRKTGKDENGMPSIKVDREERDIPGLTIGSIKKAVRRLQAQTATRDLRLRLQCAGASVVSASQIEQDVQNFSREGWVPDIVVLDYADLLLTEAHAAKLDYRNQINESWKVLRRISLDYHLLMITATQAAARAYDALVIKKKDFSEDKRKNAHVTGMIGLNQTSAEKEGGIYRLNWVLLRDGPWSDHRVLWTAGNLALGCPCIKSSL